MRPLYGIYGNVVILPHVMTYKSPESKATHYMLLKLKEMLIHVSLNVIGTISQTKFTSA